AVLDVAAVALAEQLRVVVVALGRGALPRPDPDGVAWIGHGRSCGGAGGVGGWQAGRAGAIYAGNAGRRCAEASRPHTLEPMLPALGPDWMDPQYLLDQFGQQFFWVSVAIIFIECGLLFPILPGDSLLFSIGLFIARGDIEIDIATACVILSTAAFAGNVTGYEIGRAIGRPLSDRDGRFIKKKYFDHTHDFFERPGSKALVIGRFVPIVRTFVTVVAGVSRMSRRRFIIWSGVGAI